MDDKMVAQLGVVRIFPAQNLKYKIAVLVDSLLFLVYHIPFYVVGLLAVVRHGTKRGIRSALFPLFAKIGSIAFR